MKASDYIVEFLIHHGITDIFGYPGGMVTHLMDSLDKYKEKITAHMNYHEQACAMAACGWAEIKGLPGVAYATSGPGATNLLTGIACAYFDSIPCIFITGQVNTYEQKGNLKVRQKGFQETDIVSISRPITKKTVMIKNAVELPIMLEQAYAIALEGRPGPVLIDIPMDVFRSEINCVAVSPNIPITAQSRKATEIAVNIMAHLQNARRPIILAGHGISLSGTRDLFRSFVEQTGIPVVTSMTAVDSIPTASPYCYGMIGAYGARWANYLINHSDCILSLGSRLDCRQTGVNKALFAPQAKILRVDVDPDEMENRIGGSEAQYCISLKELLPTLAGQANCCRFNFQNWRTQCLTIRKKLENADKENAGNQVAKMLGEILGDHITIVTDVGQNQVWIAQSMEVKEHQRVLFTGGHGAMGYSLPAAIGASVATGQNVICITGDGGLQMNLQELQFVVRENLPIKIVLMNNHALGMIHHFQEMYFGSNYMQTDDSKGFTTPDFIKIAQAYGIRALRDPERNKFLEVLMDSEPVFIEISLPQTTHVFPKLGLNKPIHEQEPPLTRQLLKELEMICNYTTGEAQ